MVGEVIVDCVFRRIPHVSINEVSNGVGTGILKGKKKSTIQNYIIHPCIKVFMFVEYENG